MCFFDLSMPSLVPFLMAGSLRGRGIGGANSRSMPDCITPHFPRSYRSRAVARGGISLGFGSMGKRELQVGFPKKFFSFALVIGAGGGGEMRLRVSNVAQKDVPFKRPFSLSVE